MSTQKSFTGLALLVLAASLVLIVATQPSSGEANVQQPERTRIKVLRRKDRLHLKPTAQEIQDDQPPPQERFLEDKIPKHLPIKLKLRKEKEKSFKDSKNDNWARDLELEVTNTGTRPIYYLVLLINMPELRVGESNLIFDLRFGDKKFANFATGAKHEDISLKPGESTILKIKEGNDLDWEHFSRGMNWPKPIRFELKFVELSFGDGTGFLSGGTPWPPANKSPGTGACLQIPNKNASKAHHVRTSNNRDDNGMWKLSLGGEAARNLLPIFLSAGFSSTPFADPVGPSLAPDSCCSGDGCQYVHEYDDFDACYDGGCSPARRVEPKLCSESGQCKTVNIVYQRCHVVEDDYNYWYNCANAVTTPCSTPTPAPTPSPSPSPSPTPQDCNLSERPNASNCSCINLPGFGPTWTCDCVGGKFADYTIFPQSGGCDPSMSSNSGANCCICNNQITCQAGSHWNNYTCQCDEDPLATPTPNNGVGDPYYYSSCTQYYWVLYECYPVGEHSWDCHEVARWEAGCWA